MSSFAVRRLRVALTTLGCKVNRADGERLLARLAPLIIQVPFGEPADLCIINSCTVTAAADRQTRQLANRARRANPAAVVVLTGCLAQASPQEAARIAAVDQVFTLSQHQRLVELVASLGRRVSSAAGFGQASPGAAPGCWRPPHGQPSTVAAADVEQELLDRRGRPLLKIQDGCDAACSYCIVPLARGPSTSVPLARAQQALRGLAASGYQEVVLTGIHLGHYGRDLDPPLDLVQGVGGLLGIVPRLRLSSIEPLEVNERLLALAAGSEQLCPHLHIPLQSGDEGILQAMGRPYRLGEAWEVFSQVRRRLPQAAIGSDLIVGFPGESEAAFARSLEFVERSPLSHLHVFPFSPRPGTVAAELPGRIAPELLRQRVQLLRAAGQRKLQRFAAAQVGQLRVVLVERLQAGGLLCGLTENYLRVTFRGEPDWAGRLVPVAIEGAKQAQLYGRVRTAPRGSV